MRGEHMGGGQQQKNRKIFGQGAGTKNGEKLRA